MVAEAVNSWASYVSGENAEVAREVQAVAREAERLLAQCDEFKGVVGTLDTEATLLTCELAPALKAKLERLDPVLQRIDRLASLVAAAKQSVGRVEAELTHAERQFEAAPLKTARSLITNIAGALRSQPAKGAPEAGRERPEIFSAEQYLGPRDDTSP